MLYISAVELATHISFPASQYWVNVRTILLFFAGINRITSVVSCSEYFKLCISGWCARSSWLLLVGNKIRHIRKYPKDFRPCGTWRIWIWFFRSSGVVLHFLWVVANFQDCWKTHDSDCNHSDAMSNVHVTFLTFAVYLLSSDDHVLDAQKVFVTLALFNTLRRPLTQAPFFLMVVIQVKLSHNTRTTPYFQLGYLELSVCRPLYQWNE